MKKEKTYNDARFPAEVLSEAATLLKTIAGRSGAKLESTILSVEHDDSSWNYDTVEEFYADYRKYQGHSMFNVYGSGYDLTVSVRARSTDVSVKAPTRAEIESVFGAFEKNLSDARLPPLPEPPAPVIRPIVFIGHGRSALWRDLKDHLQDKHGVRVEAYETGAKAGHTIRDILEELVSKSSFALLVLTAEDEQAGGTYRARQNVVHETGLFQGRLGFSKAIILLEEGAEEFSNILGLQQIHFSKGNIRETFGEVLATLKREFGTHG